MNWKNWPYWVRGGVIFSAISTLTILVLRLFVNLSELDWIPLALKYDMVSNADSLGSFVSMMHYPVFILERISGMNLGSSRLAIYLSTIIMMFVIGTILGYLYGKFKNRKQVINNL